jgi:diguanylate cyclase (GGDEF)-like protein/PAS domain S-box-containing protein
VGYSQSNGYRDYPGLGWGVLVRQPLEDAYRPVQALKRKILYGGLVAALLAPLLVWALARGMARPLQTITRHADQLRTGVIDDLPPLPSRLAEVQILHRALRALLAKVRANETGLRELNAHLETRVLERTAELHAAVEETRLGEQRVRAIIDTAHDAFVGMDAAGAITDWNPRAEQIFGWTRAEALGRAVADTIIPVRLRAAHEHGMRRFMATGSAGGSGIVNTRIQQVALRRDGGEFPIEMTVGVIGAGNDRFFGAFIQDISERKRIEDELARERELLDVVLDSIDVGVAVCSREGEITLFNRAMRAMHGLPPAPLSPGEWSGHYGLFGPDGVTPLAPSQIPLLRALNGELVQNSELVVKPANGAAHFVLASGRALHAADGGNIGAVIALKDVTELKEAARRMERLARIDTLTGLPNRRSHDERLAEALQRARRTGTALALMFLDVDRFKQVNDTLGHAGGDTVLQEFARRVRAAVRVTDTVCRLAGDEFTVILEGLKSADEAALVARKILAAFEQPFDLDGAARAVSTSIGVAYVSRLPVDACALSAAADRALYAAKDGGRARFALHHMTDGGG